MPIIISDSLVVSQEQEFDADNPVIGWETLITAGSVRSGLVNDPDTSADNTDWPASNLANPSTAARWQADAEGSDVFLEVTLDGLNDVDYLAFAKHNLGTERFSLQVFGATGRDANDDPVYFSLTQDFILENDNAVLVRFETGSYIAIKLMLTITNSGETENPRIAVMYVGKLLVCERKLQVAFTPITMGRHSNVLSGRSEDGQFLGRVITSQWLETSANFAFMSPDWYREFFDEFVENAQTEPFFFAWAPVSYPYEVGYVWLTGDATPSISHSAPNISGTGLGLMSVTLNMQGVA
jgi:hypothetical protein